MISWKIRVISWKIRVISWKIRVISWKIRVISWKIRVKSHGLLRPRPLSSRDHSELSIWLSRSRCYHAYKPSFMTVLVITHDNYLEIHFTEYHKKLSFSAAVCGKY